MRRFAVGARSVDACGQEETAGAGPTANDADTVGMLHALSEGLAPRSKNAKHQPIPSVGPISRGVLARRIKAIRKGLTVQY